MEHLNGDLICAIDVETTGLVPGHNEIVQLAAVVLGAHFKPVQSIQPFNIHIIPEHDDRWDKVARQLSVDRCDLRKVGVDRYTAEGLFLDWHDKLPLKVTKYGLRKKIEPLGHNYAAFDRAFLVEFFGHEMYEERFDYHIRDTMLLATYLNDRRVSRCEPATFPKSNLGSCASRMGVKVEGTHDALADCYITAELYQRMVASVFGSFS